MEETIPDVLRRVIAKQAHLDPSVITPSSALSELGVTSLDSGRDHHDNRGRIRRNHSGECRRSLERLQNRRGPR